MKVLLIKNIIREGPGLLETLLSKYNIDSELIELDRGEKFPDLHGYNAVFVFGGPDSANDTTPKMLQELEQIKKLITAGIPYFGVCLGLQTLVKALGGEIYKNNVSEIGWRDPDNHLFTIDLTEEGKKDELFEDLKSPLKIFHLHGETVRLTPNMKLLATGRFCRNQAVKKGENAYGLQGHFELNRSMFEIWMTEDPDLKKLNNYQLEKDYQDIQKEYELTGNQLFTNFLKIAKLI